MILVRNVFRLKFGKAKEAVALWKEAVEIQRGAGIGTEHRLLSDLAGAPFYTLVYEVTYRSLSEMEQAASQRAGTEEWSRLYEKIIPLVEEGHREVLNILA